MASCVLPSLHLQQPCGISVGGHYGCSRGSHSRWQCPQSPRVVGGEQEAACRGLGPGSTPVMGGRGRRAAAVTAETGLHQESLTFLACPELEACGQPFPSPPLHPSPGCS